MAGAKLLRPDAHLMLINEAWGAFEHAHHFLAGHGEKVHEFLAYRTRQFPNAPPPTSLHASRRGGTDPAGVTHIWENVSTGGTSAWKAVRIGKAMGYEELILCGCPINDSGYFFGKQRTGITVACDRIGDGEGRMYHNYRTTFAVRAKGEGQGVFSMSGYSRELLGAPAARSAA
ncbi:MAG TPA: hypothetical protein VFY80_06275 [Burkholderiales bacterium]|nr:hypothetical protein [Burkholderiales bacterium]